LTGGAKEPDLPVSGIMGGRDGETGGESGWECFGHSGLLRLAVKAGPWIFLNGHEAFDFESGIPEAVAGLAGFPLHAARATPQNASVVPLAALPPGPFPAPLSSGSKTGQITRYKNRTDHESATPPSGRR
jgi:hypothetical protein